MECSSCGGLMFRNGRVSVHDISSGAWKTGLGESQFGKLWTRTDASRRVQDGKRLNACPVREVFRIVECSSELITSRPFAGNSCSGFQVGALRWVDPGTSFKVQIRPFTAVEAGRSKAQKEKRRLAQLPPRKPRPSPQGDVPVGQSRGEDGNVVNQGKGSVDAMEAGASSVIEGRVSEENALNLTWQEAGLGDRRLGGRFRPEKPSGSVQMQRVGGWGRDKSMQRVITPEQQREAMIRAKAKEERRAQATARPKKKKLYEGFDNDPNVQHPPEYYKYGPFGPYAWKGIPVGEPVRGDFITGQVFIFSDVKDVADGEDRIRANVAADYVNKVARFKKTVGIQYFYAFARRKYGPRSDPWKDWSLVAQIAIESGEDHSDQAQLFLGMGSKVQDLTTTLVAWARPDLVYVRKPVFDLRLEPQESFMKGLMDLLKPVEETISPSDSFYGTLCKLLNVNLQASALEVRAAYDALPEDGKLKCLKHVFSNHPVKLVDINLEHEKFVDNPSSNPEQQERDEEGLADETQERHAVQTDWDPWSPRQIKLLGVEETEQATEDGLMRRRRKVPKRKRLKVVPKFKSAVTPFTYSNFVEEIALLWEYMSYGKVNMDIPSSESS